MMAAATRQVPVNSASKVRPRTFLRWGVIAVVAVGLAAWFKFGSAPNSVVSTHTETSLAAAATSLKLADIPIDGSRAYEYLKQLCALGSRTSGTPGMAKQQELLTKHFKSLGAKIGLQRFSVLHPQTGNRVALGNLIVEWHPDRKERILLCAHYDTRPHPDRDPDVRKRAGVFLGANDGASGTALLMELAHHIAKYDGKLGVDFVLFDGEELVYDERRDANYYFLGSKWFATEYAKRPPKHRYKYGILLDMVGDASLQIFQERNSLGYPGGRELVRSVWAVAAKLGVREFIAEARHDVRDDHLPLNEIAKIPTIDIIDFDYPTPDHDNSYWHTAEDRPENCSALSLAKVGWVVWEWCRQAAP